MNRILETKRLILRPWKDSDAERIVEGLSDFDTAKMLVVPFPYTKKDAIEFLEKRKDDDENSFYFAITLKESGIVIGGTNICVDVKDNTNGGGIWLDKKYQGFGFGSEAWTARARFAFFELKLEKLYNGYFDYNQASPKMQQKIGYKIVGERDRFCPALGKNVKEIRTILTRDDFINITGIKS